MYKIKKEYVHNSDLNLELFIITEIMKLNSLHYGYWDRQEEIDLDSVREAQCRYTQTLINLIPDDVSNILDVGCGIGDNAKAFAEEGYNVTAISPDLNHGKFFEDQINGKIKFIQSKIEELNISDTFDLVLMSESQNYFSILDGIRQSYRYLKPNGYLLISGNFRKSNLDLFDTIHTEEKYHNTATHYGFKRLNRWDITENVIPTLSYTNDLYYNYLIPILDLIETYAKREMPIRAKIAKLFLNGKLKQIVAIQEYYDDFLDVEKYKNHICYLRLIYQKNSKIKKL